MSKFSPVVKHTKCRITSVGKRRDGGTRFWCLEHRADATKKYGTRARHCYYARVPVITTDEVLDLIVTSYDGGVALWGAVPPIYDTTLRPIDRGVHVHARHISGGDKVIDGTYRAVRLIDEHKTIAREGLLISELEAIYYMVSSIFGFSTKNIRCTRCGFPHLDRDWFSVHAHRRHLCAGCGQYFRDTDIAVGNPIVRVKESFGETARPAKLGSKPLLIRQAEYPGGIQIWASNPSILWTGSQREKEGIHIHVATEDGSENIIDDTFSRVTIDGIKLDPVYVRVYMAQRALPHLTGRLTDVHCPSCNTAHFDTGEFAFTPHDVHSCSKCGQEFRSSGKLRKTIGNPMVGIMARLAESSPRTPQEHDTNLLPEIP